MVSQEERSSVINFDPRVGKVFNQEERKWVISFHPERCLVKRKVAVIKI